jgi:hypothetical protein
MLLLCITAVVMFLPNRCLAKKRGMHFTELLPSNDRNFLISHFIFNLYQYIQRML